MVIKYHIETGLRIEYKNPTMPRPVMTFVVALR